MRLMKVMNRSNPGGPRWLGPAFLSLLALAPAASAAETEEGPSGKKHRVLVELYSSQN